MEDKRKTERKCLGEVTNTSAGIASKNTNHHYLPPPPQSQRFLPMELKLMELNSRLDILSEKFEHLIAKVRKTNDLLQLDLQVSIENRVISHGMDEETIKENAKRAILGDEGYSIYRKTLKPKQETLA
jgi:hypothetical protein